MDLLSFPDHHEYPSSSIEKISQRAAEVGADVIITTEKDATKLRHVADYPILSLVVDLELVGSTAREFAKIIRGLFHSLPCLIQKNTGQPDDLVKQ